MLKLRKILLGWLREADTVKDKSVERIKLPEIKSNSKKVDGGNNLSASVFEKA